MRSSAISCFETLASLGQGVGCWLYRVPQIVLSGTIRQVVCGSDKLLQAAIDTISQAFMNGTIK